MSAHWVWLSAAFVLIRGSSNLNGWLPDEIDAILNRVPEGTGGSRSPMSTDDPQAASPPSARSKVPDRGADAPKTHDDAGNQSALLKKRAPASSRGPSIVVGGVIAALVNAIALFEGAAVTSFDGRC